MLAGVDHRAALLRRRQPGDHRAALTAARSSFRSSTRAAGKYATAHVCTRASSRKTPRQLTVGVLLLGLFHRGSALYWVMHTNSAHPFDELMPHAFFRSQDCSDKPVRY
jgi:hypothetical protein